MHIARLGLSVLKGAQQTHPGHLPLADHGPLADRAFCCVDVQAAQVLRTVQNPALLALHARVEVRGAEQVLTVTAPGGSVSAPVRPERDAAGTARTLVADYWGRRPRLELLAGPWSGLLSEHLGRPVQLARAAPRAVVYGGGVTLVTTSSLREVARRAGGPTAPTDPSADLSADLLADADRWRATAVVDTGGAPAFVEDGWLGGRLVVAGGQPGDRAAVVLRVRSAVPRCAVVRIRPGTGLRESLDPLALLAADRTRDGQVVFGVDAEVESPGTLQVGDVLHAPTGAERPWQAD